MEINLSAAEIGKIIFALNSCFPRNSEEIQEIALPLYGTVYKFLGREFYSMWVDEFELNENEVLL